MQINFISTSSLMITFDNIISKECSLKVQKAYHCIKNLNDKAIVEVIPSYTTIFISYDIFVYDFNILKNILEKSILNFKQFNNVITQQFVTIDVYYGLEVGLDIEQMSRDKNLSIDDIISIHSQKVYDVYAIGFLPGFGFLGEVDKRIATTRFSTPRKKVLKGSVAIADTQTAVYPKNSAGGWNIIGRTTKELFIKNSAELSPLSVGKKVKFNPITKKKFLSQGGIC